MTKRSRAKRDGINLSGLRKLAHVVLQLHAPEMLDNGALPMVPRSVGRGDLAGIPPEAQQAMRVLWHAHHLEESIRCGDVIGAAENALHLGRYVERIPWLPEVPRIKGKRTSERNIRPGSEPKESPKAFCMEVNAQLRAERKSGGKRSMSAIRRELAAAWGISEATAKRYWKLFGSARRPRPKK